MLEFRTDFQGTGNMEGFCEESNKLFAALNNVVFQMPSGYSGIEPTMRVEAGRIVFDFGECLVFTLNNVSWSLTGSANFISNSVEVVNGQLVISVVADDPD